MQKTNPRSKVIILKNPKKRKLSSSEWLKRQLQDPYVAKAKLDGFRSRAAYKLLEIHEKFKIFRPNMNIIDLGSAPGGWSQIAVNLTSDNSKIIALDLLEMEKIANVTFIQKDFLDEDAPQIIKDLIGDMADLVMSDMAANTMGHKATDHIRIIALCENAINFALEVLKPGGHFIAKIFQGGADNNILNLAKRNFKIVKHFKPNSSRKESSEYYLVALNRKP